MRKRIKYLLILPLTAIVSCGYSTSYLVEGDKYVSANFKENYYKVWNDELTSAKKEAPINVSSESYIYDYGYYGNVTLNGFGSIDPNYFDKDPLLEEYGQEFKMVGVDDSFRYGYQSKLFDGQLVCGAQNGQDGQDGRPDYRYQKGRVQTAESGFSVRFSKESNELQYFALQFKASTDNTREYYTIGGNEYDRQPDDALYHDSSIELKITLFLKNNIEIIGYPFLVDVDFDNNTTNVGTHYTFIAFDLNKYKTDTFAFTRLVGVSIEYEVLSDALIDYNKNEKGVPDISYDDYALFLYEMFFPYTSWN
ncbi:MAG: hypothetical protein IJQ72_02840 [Bacilli bacterium]|nr:hypothetical protein [Bacilli bacterium]